MNQQLEIPQPPNPVSPDQTHGTGLTAVSNQVKALAKWTSQFTLWFTKQFLGPLINQVNSQTQGFSTQPSAATVSLSSAITHITGNVVITTLRAPATFSGVAWLVADGAFSLATGGNIAVSMGPCTVGETLRVTFDGATMMWYPSHDFTYLTPTSPYTLPAANGSFQEIEIKNTTGTRLIVNPAGSDTIEKLPREELPQRSSARFTDAAQGIWNISPKSAGTLTLVLPTSTPYTLPQAIGSLNWHGLFNTTGLGVQVFTHSGDKVFPSLTGFILAASGGGLLVDYAAGFWARLI